jgi:hypothetical protein
MPTVKFAGIPFTINHEVMWKGRAVELSCTFPSRFAELLAVCKAGVVGDLVVGGRSTRAMVMKWSIDQDAARRELGTLTLNFYEDPAIPARVERLHDLTGDELAQFGWVMRGERRPASSALACMLFLTAAETGERYFLGDASELERRPTAEVALFAGTTLQVAMVSDGLKVHRHLARQEGGGLVWLYTTDPEPQPVCLETAMA